MRDCSLRGGDEAEIYTATAGEGWEGNRGGEVIMTNWRWVVKPHTIARFFGTGKGLPGLARSGARKHGGAVDFAVAQHLNGEVGVFKWKDCGAGGDFVLAGDCHKIQTVAPGKVGH